VITHHEHIGLPRRLRLASQFVYHAEGGWVNALLNFVGLIALPVVILLDYLIFSVKSPDLPHKRG
jgi:hypothetical protein